MLKIYRSDNELYKIENFSSTKDFELIFNKIKIDAYEDQNEEFAAIRFLGDFSKAKKLIYAQLADDSQLYVVDSLDQFSENYNTEKKWKIEKWTEI